MESGHSLDELSPSAAPLDNLELIRASGADVMFENTPVNYNDGQPAISYIELPVMGLTSIWGILNATTNLVLSRLEAGDSFDEAVRYSQEIGIAETDPSGDIDGWDAAVKVAALITVLMDHPFTPDMVERTGIRSITPEMIAKAKAEGKRYKLVAHAWKEGETSTGRQPSSSSNQMCWGNYPSLRKTSAPGRPLTVCWRILLMP